MSTILLQRYANREYRLTAQTVLSPKKKAGDKYVECQAEKYALAVRDTYVLQQEIMQGEAALVSGGKLERRSFGEVDARIGIRALDIINEFHLVQKVVQKGGWGHLSKPTSFTKNARHRLLEAGAIVDKICGLNAYEITCTLPGSTSDSMQLLAENTGWIMNELTREIRKAKCKYWFYVWEYQKRGALHLHLLVADAQENLENLALTLERRWWVLLQSISDKTGRDAFARKEGGTWAGKSSRWQSHTSSIKKSVAAYFSKYAGKGQLSFSKNNSPQKFYPPSRWWGCSTEIKKEIKAHRLKLFITVSTSTSVKILDYLSNWLNQPKRLKHYEYDFQLGKTKNGTELGGGHVEVNYYSDMDFARMQTWEKQVWDDVLAIAHSQDEYDYPRQAWSNADMACPTPYDADVERRHEFYADINYKSRTPSPSPHSQPFPDSRKLSKSRGTQPQAALELRARLVQFLAGGGGEVPISISNNSPHLSANTSAPEYIQGKLFCKELYNVY